MQNKRAGSRRIFGRPARRGTGRISRYVTRSATPRTGKRTSEMVRLFRSEPLVRVDSAEAVAAVLQFVEQFSDLGVPQGDAAIVG